MLLRISATCRAGGFRELERRLRGTGIRERWWELPFSPQLAFCGTHSLVASSQRRESPLPGEETVAFRSALRVVGVPGRLSGCLMPILSDGNFEH